MTQIWAKRPEGLVGEGERLTRTKAMNRIWSCMAQREGEGHKETNVRLKMLDKEKNVVDEQSSRFTSHHWSFHFAPVPSVHTIQVSTAQAEPHRRPSDPTARSGPNVPTWHGGLVLPGD